MKPFIWRLDGVFTWVLASSLQASVLVCLILAVQAIARRKLPPRWYYALWFLLIARMLLPWVPESRLSVFNLMPVSPPVTGLPLSGTSDDVFINQAIDWPAEPLLPVFVAPESAPLTETPSALGLPRAPVRRLALPFLPMAWLVGVLAFTGYVLAENVLFWLRLRREPMAAEPELLGLLAACKGEMGVHIPVGVVPTDRVNSPAVFGFVRPRLLLPRKALETLTQDELRYVFLHELAHLKRRDILVNWVLTALQGLHWFNPLIWYAFHRMRMDRELACDALALSYTRPGESKAYGNTIVGLVEQLYKVRRVPGLAGILEDKSQLKRRITMIALFKKHSWRLSLVALVVVAALGAVALTNAKADTTSTGGQPLSAPVSMPQDSGGAYAGDSDDNDVAMINNVAEKPLQRPQDVKLVQDEVAENGEGAAADSEPIRRVTAPVVQTGGHPAHDKAEKPTAMEAEAGKALDTLVSLDFTDTHISEIVKGLADAVQYNIVIDSRVVAPKEGAAPVSVPEGYRPAAFITDGVVPYINAANVPLHEVLEDLTEMLNLDYTVQPGFIWISTPLRIRMEAGFEELETRYYYLKARGREAADTVELLRKTVPDVFEFMGATERRLSSMEFNPEHNRLVVRNTPSNLSLLEQLLKRLDIAAGDQTEDKRLQGAAEVPPFGVRRVDWSHNRLRIPLGSIDVGGSIPFIEITLQKTMQLPDGSARARLQVEKQSKAGHAQRHSMWYSEGERILGHDASDPFVCKVVRVDAEDGTCDVYSGKTDSIFTLRLSNSDGGKEPVAPAAQARDLSDGRGVPRLGEHGNVAAPGAEPQAGPQKPADEAARRRVEGILEGPVSLDFEGEHISTILDFIRRYLDVKIELDNTVVAPRPGTEPPTDAEQADQYVTDGIVEDIAVRNVPLYEGLHALLQPLFLDFGIRGDAIWISTPEKIREQLGGRFAPAPVPKESPLHEAARDGHQDAVRRLLRRGADINAKDDAGRTPLHWAAANGHVGMVKFLVSRGADVNTKDNDGRCPIHLAAQNGHEATLTMLAVRGADVMPKDKAGKTPLDLAREGGHKQTAAAIELYAPDASGGGSRQNDAAGQAGDSPEAAESDEAQEPGEQIVTADLRNMRLADVLQVLRERAGNIEIIAHVDDTVP
ncbi:MAG TPA: hypothetical protein HPP77_01640, partial [Candidatus Hydrogenedentes bacterium]|nr:hypothetical protein [Candidatus Hydrogenedentota bacterium]